MKSFWKLAMVAILAVASTRAPSREARLEPPRATDLLHAERRAEEARERLERPRERTGSWVRGGGGWGEPSRPERRDGDVRR